MKWVHRIFAILTFGPIVMWLLALASVMYLGFIAGCRIDEGNIHPCTHLGLELGRLANTLGFFASWGVILFGAFSMIAGFVWGVTALIVHLARR